MLGIARVFYIRNVEITSMSIDGNNIEYTFSDGKQHSVYNLTILTNKIRSQNPLCKSISLITDIVNPAKINYKTYRTQLGSNWGKESFDYYVTDKLSSFNFTAKNHFLKSSYGIKVGQYRCYSTIERNMALDYLKNNCIESPAEIKKISPMFINILNSDIIKPYIFEFMIDILS